MMPCGHSARRSRVVSLTEVVTSRAGKTPSRSNPSYWGGTVPWVTAKDLKSHRLKDSLDRITEEAVRDGAPLARPGDVLILVRGMTLMKDVPIGLVETAMSFNQDVRCLRPTDDISGEYLSYLLAAMRQHLLGLVTQAGHGTGRLESSQLETVTLRLPSAEIQGSATAQIRAVERSVDAIARLLCAKREFRRGLMQQLLTGQRRFPDLVRSDSWESIQLGDLLEDVSEAVQWDDAAIYRLASIRRRNAGIFHREAKRGVDIKTKALFTIRASDFLISRMQAVHGALAVVPSEFDGYQVSGMYMVLRPKTPVRIRTEFLHLASHLRQMYRNVLISSHGVHIEKMTFDPKKFMRTRILIPPTLEEQDRITAVLQVLDREIALLEQQRDAYEARKRALLQRILSGDFNDLDPAA